MGRPTSSSKLARRHPGASTGDKKYNIYLQAGVQHYWIVDPEEKTVRCYALHEDKYILIAKGREGDVVNHPSFAGLSLHLAPPVERDPPVRRASFYFRYLLNQSVISCKRRMRCLGFPLRLSSWFSPRNMQRRASTPK